MAERIVVGKQSPCKTSTIVALVRCLRALGKSVLISAYTHSAVDNVLVKLLQHPDISGDSILRLGSRHQIKSECAHLTLSAKLENVPQPAMYDSIANIYSTVVSMRYSFHQSFGFMFAH
uniref:DNA helicase n=1 Tax=Plectus sambesii TaxID=2011161 RepID=A0A914WD84_9BILA